MWLLSIIGLFIILWVLSRVLVRIGDWLEKTGNALCEISSSMSRPEKRRAVNQDSNEISERIKGLKGEDDHVDSDWEDQVRREIEELTE